MFPSKLSFLKHYPENANCKMRDYQFDMIKIKHRFIKIDIKEWKHKPETYTHTHTFNSLKLTSKSQPSRWMPFHKTGDVWMVNIPMKQCPTLWVNEAM